jgi:hypothetical protein
MRRGATFAAASTPATRLALLLLMLSGDRNRKQPGRDDNGQGRAGPYAKSSFHHREPLFCNQQSSCQRYEFIIGLNSSICTY